MANPISCGVIDGEPLFGFSLWKPGAQHGSAVKKMLTIGNSLAVGRLRWLAGNIKREAGKRIPLTVSTRKSIRCHYLLY